MALLRFSEQLRAEYFLKVESRLLTVNMYRQANGGNRASDLVPGPALAQFKGPEQDQVLADFQSALGQANARVLAEAAERPELRGMGTTLTLAYSAISYKTPWCMLGFLHGMILLAGIGAVALIRMLAQRGLQVALGVLLLGATGETGGTATICC